MKKKKKRFLLFLIVMLLGFSLAWAGDNPKEKKVYFRFSVGYGLPLGTDSVRPSWDLGYTTVYVGQTGYSWPLDPLNEVWFCERWFQCRPQMAPAPTDYYYFVLNGEVPDFYFKPGDRTVYNGYSRSDYKNVIPQINLGIDLRITKGVFFAVDVFARQDQLKVQEEGYILYVKQVWGPYYELPAPDGHYQDTDWYLDTVMEHPKVEMVMDLWNFGINPSLKFEIPISRNFSIFPRFGVALFMSKAKVQSDWTLNFLYPYDYVFMYHQKPNYFGDISWQIKQNKTEFSLAPVVGLDFGNNIFFNVELQLGSGKNFSVTNDDSEHLYKGLLLYNNNSQKMRFPDIDPGYERVRHKNYGKPMLDDGIHLNKLKLLKISAGFRF
ncbi:MAG TPA: hypothetical protein PLM04_08685 [Paludibacteraceae bacterium]|nr:hypothetical protein [Paludibacteraceae bacterium]